MCGLSVCENYKYDYCANQCYEQDKINEKNISLKILDINSDSSLKYESDLIWQKISGYGIRVFSAFKSQNNILIIAQVQYDHNSYDNQFQCVFTDQKKTIVLGESDAVFEKFEKVYDNYTKTRIRCQLYSNSVYVKLVDKHVANIETNYIYLNPDSRDVSSDNEIVICTQPLFGPYNSIRSLLEFIAYYRINGIKKIVIYNDSISQQVSQLLQSMPEIVEIIPWHSSHDVLHNRRLDKLSSIDECLHRFRNKIILLMDIDEYFIPFSHKTLKQFVVNERKDLSVAALSLQNVFFCCEFNTNTRQSFPRISNQFNRQKYVWSKGIRSKIIVLRTELVDHIGIHDVHQLSDNYSSIIKHVDENDALMFHYRTCCNVERTPIFNGLLSFRTLSDSVIVDRRMNKFTDQVRKFIQNYIYL